jgi:hypothetical protein
MAKELTGQRVVADFAAYVLRFGLLQPAQVIAWADALIAHSDVAAPWMLDLSLVDKSDPHAVVAQLRRVPGDSNLRESIDLLSGLVLRQWKGGRLTIGDVRGIGWRVHLEHPDCCHWGAAVECRGEELDDGHISEADMREVIDRELASFWPELQRLPSWV